MKIRTDFVTNSSSSSFGTVNWGTPVDSTTNPFLLIAFARKSTLWLVFTVNRRTTGVKLDFLATAYPTSPLPVTVTAGPSIL